MDPICLLSTARLDSRNRRAHNPISPFQSYAPQVRKGFWKQPPLIWDVNPRQVRILNPFFMEIAADKLLSLPMQQPRKIKQVHGVLVGGGGWRVGKPEVGSWDRMFLEAWEALEDPKRGKVTTETPVCI